MSYDGYGGIYGEIIYGGGFPRPYAPGHRESITPASWVAIPRLYLADIEARKLDTLYPSKAEAATAAYNDDWETKRQGTVEVRYPDNLIRMRNYVIVELEMVRDDGLVTTVPLIHGVVIGHDLTTSNVARTGTVHLRDLTWILAESSLVEQTTAPAGVDPGLFVRDLLIQYGVPSSRVNIPAAGVLLTTPVVSKPDERVLTFATDVLAAGAMYQPWLAADFRITSKKMLDITTAPANGSYHSGNGAKIRPPITEPLEDMENLYNRVTVSKITKKGGDEADEVIFAEATVTNRASPIHPDRLRDRLGWGSPVVRSLPIENAEVATQAEAQTMANARLAEGGSRYRKVSFSTYPDHTLDGHQILDLDLVYPGDGRHWYTGKWWQRAWSVQLKGPEAIAHRECFVTVPWR